MIDKTFLQNQLIAAKSLLDGYQKQATEAFNQAKKDIEKDIQERQKTYDYLEQRSKKSPQDKVIFDDFKKDHGEYILKKQFELEELKSLNIFDKVKEAIKNQDQSQLNELERFIKDKLHGKSN